MGHSSSVNVGGHQDQRRRRIQDQCNSTNYRPVPIIAHNALWDNQCLNFALQAVGLGCGLIVCKKILNVAVTVSGLKINKYEQ